MFSLTLNHLKINDILLQLLKVTLLGICPTAKSAIFKEFIQFKELINWSILIMYFLFKLCKRLRYMFIFMQNLTLNLHSKLGKHSIICIVYMLY